jgi:hypothetical protein
VPPRAKILVGGKKTPFPVIPVQVGEQFTILARSRFPTQLAIPQFGLVGFATANTPARFELVIETPGQYGILFEPSGKVAARIQAMEPKAKTKRKKTKPRARGESGQP